MRLPVPLPAPLHSSAYKAFLRWAGSRTSNIDQVRRLAWRIGAHPLLIAHGRLFENLLAIAHSPPLSVANLLWASGWKTDDLPAWRLFLQICSDEVEELGALDGLDLYLAEPENAEDHPFLGAHVDRHPVAAALWNRHHSASNYPPPPGNSAGNAYFHLQTHLFCAYVEARARAKIGLEEFESHTDEREFAPVPIGAGPVGRTVREFSLPKYDHLMLQLPREESTKEFAKALLDVPLDLRQIPEESWPRAQQYFENLQIYFARFFNLLGVEKIDPRKRNGGPTTTDGGSKTRPGFVHFDGGYLRITDSEDPLEEGFPSGVLKSVKLTYHSETGETPDEIEASGLAPEDMEDDLLDLYSPDEIARQLGFPPCERTLPIGGKMCLGVANGKDKAVVQRGV